MINSVCVLGRQPAIGLAELESLYGPESLQPVSDNVVGLTLPADDIVFSRLGGCLKLARVVGHINETNWSAIQTSLLSRIDEFMPVIKSGKIQFGISAYGLKINVRDLLDCGYKIKKALREKGQSSRLVPNQSLELNSAQVLHNRLTGDHGVELIVIKYREKIIVARTMHVQNITAYTYRDRQRPKRDMRVGMLPPKLAQIIVNLATPHPGDTVLDPFCGTGVLLQEAALMGYDVYGSDLEPRMIDYSKANLEWLKHHFDKPQDFKLEVSDATTAMWSDFNVVASEVYLGQLFSSVPDTEKLATVINTCNKIIQAFLVNIHPQLPAKGRMCLALPAWYNPVNNRFTHLPLLDHIASLGYNRVSFSNASEQDLIYYRPGQIVGRELVVITRN